jgi:hypothetical protein
MAAVGATTWILTASPETRAATADHGFTVTGAVAGRTECMHAAGVSA